MRRIVWAHKARRDLDKIRDDFLIDRPDLYADLLIAILKAEAFIAQTPGAGPVVQDTGWRKWRIGRTPFLMFYSVAEAEVSILHIFHDRQDWP